MRRVLYFTFLLLASTWVWLAAQSWELKGVLRSDVSKNESVLWVELNKPLMLDRLLVIESRDGRLRGGYEVERVLEEHVLLKKSLRESYPRGSRIFQ